MPASGAPPSADQEAADQAAIAGAKAMLRKAIQFRRDTRTAAERTQDDEARLSIITGSLADRMPDTVAAYLSTGSEPGTLQLVAWLAAHRVRVLLPVLSALPDGSRRTEPAWAPYAGPDALRAGRPRDPGADHASPARASSCPRPSW